MRKLPDVDATLDEDVGVEEEEFVAGLARGIVDIPVVVLVAWARIVTNA